MRFPSKAVKGKNEIVFNATKNCSILKNYFASLAHNLVSKLLLSPNIFTESKIASHCDNNTASKDLNFQLIFFQERRILKKILSILKGLNPTKAAGVDNLSGKLLKDGAFSATYFSTS